MISVVITISVTLHCTSQSRQFGVFEFTLLTSKIIYGRFQLANSWVQLALKCEKPSVHTNIEFPVISSKNDKKKSTSQNAIESSVCYKLLQVNVYLTATFKVKKINKRGKPLCTINAGLTVLFVWTEFAVLAL